MMSAVDKTDIIDSQSLKTQNNREMSHIPENQSNDPNEAIISSSNNSIKSTDHRSGKNSFQRKASTPRNVRSALKKQQTPRSNRSQSNTPKTDGSFLNVLSSPTNSAITNVFMNNGIRDDNNADSEFMENPMVRRKSSYLLLDTSSTEEKSINNTIESPQSSQNKFLSQELNSTPRHDEPKLDSGLIEQAAPTQVVELGSNQNETRQSDLEVDYDSTSFNFKESVRQSMGHNISLDDIYDSQAPNLQGSLSEAKKSFKIELDELAAQAAIKRQTPKPVTSNDINMSDIYDNSKNDPSYQPISVAAAIAAFSKMASSNPLTHEIITPKRRSSRMDLKIKTMMTSSDSSDDFHLGDIYSSSEDSNMASMDSPLLSGGSHLQTPTPLSKRNMSWSVGMTPTSEGHHSFSPRLLNPNSAIPIPSPQVSSSSTEPQPIALSSSPRLSIPVKERLKYALLEQEKVARERLQQVKSKITPPYRQVRGIWKEALTGHKQIESEKVQATKRTVEIQPGLVKRRISGWMEATLPVAPSSEQARNTVAAAKKQLFEAKNSPRHIFTPSKMNRSRSLVIPKEHQPSSYFFKSGPRASLTITTTITDEEFEDHNHSDNSLSPTNLTSDITAEQQKNISPYSKDSITTSLGKTSLINLSSYILSKSENISECNLESLSELQRLASIMREVQESGVDRPLPAGILTSSPGDGSASLYNHLSVVAVVFRSDLSEDVYLAITVEAKDSFYTSIENNDEACNHSFKVSVYDDSDSNEIAVNSESTNSGIRGESIFRQMINLDIANHLSTPRVENFDSSLDDRGVHTFNVTSSHSSLSSSGLSLTMNMEESEENIVDTDMQGEESDHYNEDSFDNTRVNMMYSRGNSLVMSTKSSKLEVLNEEDELDDVSDDNDESIESDENIVQHTLDDNNQYDYDSTSGNNLSSNSNFNANKEWQPDAVIEPNHKERYSSENVPLKIHELEAEVAIIVDNLFNDVATKISDDLQKKQNESNISDIVSAFIDSIIDDVEDKHSNNVSIASINNNLVNDEIMSLVYSLVEEIAARNKETLNVLNQNDTTANIENKSTPDRYYESLNPTLPENSDNSFSTEGDVIFQDEIKSIVDDIMEGILNSFNGDNESVALDKFKSSPDVISRGDASNVDDVNLSDEDQKDTDSEGIGSWRKVATSPNSRVATPLITTIHQSNQVPLSDNAIDLFANFDANDLTPNSIINTVSETNANEDSLINSSRNNINESTNSTENEANPYSTSSNEYKITSEENPRQSVDQNLDSTNSNDNNLIPFDAKYSIVDENKTTLSNDSQTSAVASVYASSIHDAGYASIASNNHSIVDDFTLRPSLQDDERSTATKTFRDDSMDEISLDAILNPASADDVAVAKAIASDTNFDPNAVFNFNMTLSKPQTDAFKYNPPGSIPPNKSVDVWSLDDERDVNLTAFGHISMPIDILSVRSLSCTNNCLVIQLSQQGRNNIDIPELPMSPNSNATPIREARGQTTPKKRSRQSNYSIITVTGTLKYTPSNESFTQGLVLRLDSSGLNSGSCILKYKRGAAASGWMMKWPLLTQSFGLPSKRFFVLRGAELSYYDNVPSFTKETGLNSGVVVSQDSIPMATLQLTPQARIEPSTKRFQSCLKLETYNPKDPHPRNILWFKRLPLTAAIAIAVSRRGVRAPGEAVWYEAIDKGIEDTILKPQFKAKGLLEGTWYHESKNLNCVAIDAHVAERMSGASTQSELPSGVIHVALYRLFILEKDTRVSEYANSSPFRMTQRLSSLLSSPPIRSSIINSPATPASTLSSQNAGYRVATLNYSLDLNISGKPKMYFELANDIDGTMNHSSDLRVIKVIPSVSDPNNMILLFGGTAGYLAWSTSSSLVPTYLTRIRISSLTPSKQSAYSTPVHNTNSNSQYRHPDITFHPATSTIQVISAINIKTSNNELHTYFAVGDSLGFVSLWYVPSNSRGIIDDPPVMTSFICVADLGGERRFEGVKSLSFMTNMSNSLPSTDLIIGTSERLLLVTLSEEEQVMHMFSYACLDSMPPGYLAHYALDVEYLKTQSSASSELEDSSNPSLCRRITMWRLVHEDKDFSDMKSSDGQTSKASCQLARQVWTEDMLSAATDRKKRIATIYQSQSTRKSLVKRSSAAEYNSSSVNLLSSF